MIVCNNCPWKWRSLPNRLDNIWQCIQCSQHLATYFRSSVTTMWPVQLQPSLRNQAVGTPAITIKGHKLQESHLAVSACCGTLGKCQVYTYYNIYIIYIINYYIYNHTIQYHTSILYSRYEMRGGSLDECQLSSLSDSNASSQKYSSTCNLFHGWEVIPQGTRKLGIRHMFSFFKLE